MPEFEYKAKKGPQEIVSGTLEAPNEDAVIEKISQRGLVPIMVRRTTELPRPTSTRQVKSQSRQKKRQLILFSQQLASLLRSGVPILRALQLMESEERDIGFKRILKTFSDQVRDGKTLSQIMDVYPQIFPATYRATIRAGERSGHLQQFLLRMAEYLKKQERVRSRIRQSMMYPTLLAFCGIASVFFIMTFVVPRLNAIFTQRGHDLPFLTKTVIGIGSWMNHYWIWLVILLVIVCAAFIQMLRRKEVRLAFDALQLTIPLLGQFHFKTEFIQFSRTLQMSLTNGLSFLESLAISIPTLSNTYLAQRLHECYEKVQQGSRFGRSLRELPEVPPMVAHLISVGEESASLDGVLQEISETYEQDIEEGIHFFTTFLEPAMILTIGGVIGTIVVAMLLPIFEMNVGL